MRPGRPGRGEAEDGRKAGHAGKAAAGVAWAGIVRETWGVSTQVEPRAPAALGDYVAGWRERARSRALRDTRLREERWQRIPDVVRELSRAFGVTRAIVFGSMARGDARADSDVDLLVEGLPAHQVIDATVVANRLMRDAWVDLVPLEAARPGVADRALAEGVVVCV